LALVLDEVVALVEVIDADMFDVVDMIVVAFVPLFLVSTATMFVVDYGCGVEVVNVLMLGMVQ
jgi:hypothetical protein